MLLNLREYHRPGEGAAGGKDVRSLDRVLELLARREVHTVPLAGGDALVGSGDRGVEAVVDLQGLGLDTIGALPGEPLRIGAMVTRQMLAENESAQQLFSGVLAESARRWSGNVQRNRATVGGTVAVATNDLLVTALLACNASIVLYARGGFQELPLAAFLPRRAEFMAAPALITEVLVPAPAPSTGAALATVARTPADAPIVATVAALTMRENRCAAAAIALAGVSSEPLRLGSAEATLAGQEMTGELIAAAVRAVVASVQPVGDFRGSADYRRAMAGVLSERALRQAWERVV